MGVNDMGRRIPQERLWFAGGSLAQCRNDTRDVGQQFKAIEEVVWGGARAMKGEGKRRASWCPDDSARIRPCQEPKSIMPIDTSSVVPIDAFRGSRSFRRSPHETLVPEPCA